MIRTFRGRWVATCVALSVLSGCSSLLPTPATAPSLFTLDDGSSAFVANASKPAPGATAKTPDGTLIINTPKAAAGYATSHIVYARRTHEIEYFAFSQWVDSPAQMLTPLIVRAVERTGAFQAVLASPTAASGRFRLDTEIIRLQQDFSAPPSRVRLTLRAVLIDTTTKAVVARREFDASVTSSSEDTYGGVVAAQAVTQRLLTELAGFCAEAVAR
jgi:cholesterol transport system auxiliary component